MLKPKKIMVIPNLRIRIIWIRTAYLRNVYFTDWIAYFTDRIDDPNYYYYLRFELFFNGFPVKILHTILWIPDFMDHKSDPYNRLSIP